ncbi:GLPGLI family protein [Halpernia humi]|uniref:GLPGLI family protein n=1 Tax=Halpernia humi TaxID=493375 RepID=A0A1H5V0R1_9FLAO|nr:GLPGLI family protein [Halpernia humi]SEF80794.1 GLPGLI family protein [Halpernia humi]
MKNLIVFLSVFLFSKSFTQVVDYKFRNNDAVLDYQLVIDQKDNMSQWRKKVDAKGDTVRGNKKTDFFVVKDNKVFANDKTLSKRIFTLDSEIMIWQKGSETKEILGYKCKSASTNFRGRNYIAFYTEQIKTDLGPWKFRGLDGLVLYVKSVDDDYEFTATKINNEKYQKLDMAYINEIFKNNTFQTWSDYAEVYKNDIDTFIKDESCNCSKDGGNIFKITKIEKIYPKLHDEGVIY